MKIERTDSHHKGVQLKALIARNEKKIQSTNEILTHFHINVNEVLTRIAKLEYPIFDHFYEYE